MAHLNGKGPLDSGREKGRGLGQCKNNSIDQEKLGKGMGARHHAGGGEGRGKRLQSYNK